MTPSSTPVPHETTSARERSAFGQFQLGRSGIGVGVDYAKVRKISTADMAAMVRDGASLDDTAEAFGVSTSTIRQRLHVAGWSSATGQPARPTRPEQQAPHARFAFVDQPWADDALCAQTDPEAFFPEKSASNREAKRICAQCFVQAECLDFALSTGERFGIWGGLSERERHTLTGTTAVTSQAAFLAAAAELPSRTAS